MKPDTFARASAEWMKSWQSLITEWTQIPPTPDLARKAEQVVKDQEWEGEGGSVKPAKQPGVQPAPKIPF